MLQNVTFYRKARSISAAQLRENEEAAVIDSPLSVGCTTGQLQLVLESGFFSSLLHGCGITWMTVGEVKIQPLQGKCWIKRLKIRQNTSNNYIQAQIKNRRVNNNSKHIILLKTTQNGPKIMYILSTYQTSTCLNCCLSLSNARIKNIHCLLRIDISNIQMAKLMQR